MVLSSLCVEGERETQLIFVIVDNAMLSGIECLCCDLRHVTVISKPI